jgi:D-alanyl-lipoteichoic acid acyltransferase DltB (MBOAT superfamily)
LWGLFKKVVIADSLASTIEQFYANPVETPGWQLLLGTYFFAIQIYCDFSGYSDIAVGCGRLLGFELTQNFRLPYFASSPREFWSRWHVTLTSWFRDYLYIPLGGNRCSEVRRSINLFTVFMVSGLWHGANWTFVIWGALNGFILLSSEMWNQRLRVSSLAKRVPTKVVKFFGWVVTFHLILVTWVFFRADSLRDAWVVLSRIMANPVGNLNMYGAYLRPASLVVVLLGVEWLRRDAVQPLAATKRKVLPWFGTALTVVAIILFGKFAHVPFIYFQF